MALVGRLSSPIGPLKTLLEQSRWKAQDASGLIAPPRQSVGAQHRRVSWVLEAVERVLAEHGEPMQAKAVHAAVEALLGQAVSWGSVKGTLASHATGPSPRFVRVGRGRYRLAGSAQN
jgi:HB1, ASXL, restriction endonuclease HTH domain